MTCLLLTSVPAHPPPCLPSPTPPSPLTPLVQAGIPLPGMPHGLMGSSGELQNMHMMGGAAMMMAAAHAAHNGSGSPGGPRGGHVKLGRGVVDPAAYQHKLFIGQIPFEVRKEWLVGCASVHCIEHPCRTVHWRLAWAARRHAPSTSSAACTPLPPPPPLPLPLSRHRPLSRTCGPCLCRWATSWSWPSYAPRAAQRDAPS